MIEFVMEPKKVVLVFLLLELLDLIELVDLISLDADIIYIYKINKQKNNAIKTLKEKAIYNLYNKTEYGQNRR